MTKSPYIATASGKHYQIYNPSGLTATGSPVDINDISHHLSQITRFTGATSRIYTVAEHSLLCCTIAEQRGLPQELQLACLMHDAHEAYINDLSTPVKMALQMQHAEHGNDINASDWQVIEYEHEQHVRKHLGLNHLFTNCNNLAIKKIDLIALAHEQHILGPRDSTPWPCLEGIEINDAISRRLDIKYFGSHHMRTHFLDKYHWLKTKVAP